MKKKLNINQASLYKGNREQGTGNRLTKFFVTLLALFTFHFSLFTFLSCEQPFKAGLGPVIDLQDPVIVLEYPAAGANIRDITEFGGHASDDFKVASVWFNLANYPDVELPSADYRKFIKDDTVFYEITDITGNDRNISWKFKIDTLYMIDAKDEAGAPVFENDGFTPKKVRAFPDGDFKIRLRVTDSAGKEVVTDEILFVIKNNPPMITVTAPSMQQGTEDGYLGSYHLNYNFVTPYKRTMDTNGLIIGSIADNTGINRINNPAFHVVDESGAPQFDNQGNPVVAELFPPQIRFWQVYFDTWPVDKYGVPVEKAYPVGYYPTLTEERWLTLGEEAGTLMEIGAKDVQFTYKLSDESGSFYAFEVRAQSKDIIHSTANYPRDYVNYDNIPAQFKQENLYVLILVREPMENPELRLYEFEDLFGDQKNGKPVRAKDPSGESNKSIMLYNDLDEPKGLPDSRDKIEGNHPYVNETSVSKKGPFTLRVKASHSGGIASAAVYWEKSDRSKKGRFIWDPVDRPAWWKGVGYNKAAHYTTWGLNEPDGVTEVRSFVFTYSDMNEKDDTTALYDRLPNSTEFVNNVMGNISGRSKIQEYSGGLNDPITGKPYKYDELPDDPLDPTKGKNWKDVYKLDEGTYNVYIYATSNSGTPVKEPLYVTISIDREGPKIDLNYIEGSAGEVRNANGERENTVNGVIRPIFQISDSRPADAGFREEIISEYFRKNPLGSPAAYYLEQSYILILESQAAAMEAELAKTKNPWPFPHEVPIPALPNIAVPVIEGVTIKKHGPLDDSSSCLIKTSYIYNNGDDKDKDDLPDGNYRLYAFARDGAFNVSYKSFPIIVKRVTDYPTIELTGSIKTGVIEPDSAFDFGGSKYGSGNPELSFIIKDSDDPRNMFTANSSIQLRIKDDDSLYIGPDVLDQPGINITLIGSRPYPVTPSIGDVIELKPYDDTYLIPFDGDAIKQAFNPLQTVEDGKRTAVIESRGSISHRMLADLVKGNPKYKALYVDSGIDWANATTLPDGIYRLGISVSDDRDAKLKMPSDPAKADAVTVNINNNTIPPDETKIFWIAVDNAKPVILDQYPGGKYIEASGIIQPGTPEPLAGIVYDENGPVTLVGWEVKDGNTVVTSMNDPKYPPGSNKPRIAVKLADGTLTALDKNNNNLTYRDYLDGKWVYDFAYWMDLNGSSKGAYNFEVTFKDRFNKQVTVSPKATVDSVPPTVSLIKPIETFSRAMLEDSEITAYTHIPANIGLNKERLSVKVVNFGIDADDSNGVVGVRWWLLPADTGVNSSGFNSTGIVSGYNAFPANKTTYTDNPGVWYGMPANPDGFIYGIYGNMEVPPNAKYIVAFDSRRLESKLPANKGNGEYRLHIIAIDSAGNTSNYLDASIGAANVFQVVFFLQEQDKPYFDKNISPGEALPNTQLVWPKQADGLTDVVMPVLGRNPIIDGTIWDNNGFFQKNTTDTLAWTGSVTVWLSGNAADLTTGWEGKVIAGTDNIAGYKMVVIPNSALGKQERNINLAIELTSLFPAEFGSASDGKKRYIIKATDSPVNKLREETAYPAAVASGTTGEGNATKMGMGNTNAEDEGIRESNYKQYAFVYDGVNPVVVIDTPLDKPTVKTYGRNFADPVNGFVLGGYISDANLATLKYYYENLSTSHPDYIAAKAAGKYDANGKYTGADANNYYFEYYLNSDTKKKFILEVRADCIGSLGNPAIVSSAAPLPTPPAATVDGKHIYAITRDENGKLTVYFRISVSDVTNDANGIIPKARFDGTGAYAGKGLSEGQNTLNVWATDVSGKEGAAWVNFIKDIEPPKITFSNLTSLTGKNSNYDKTNESIVDKLSSGSVVGWWSKTAAQRQALLLVNNPPTAPRPLPLTTIYYDNGIPQLRGNINDLVSVIDLTTGANSAVGSGDINISPSAFKYWFDKDTLNDASARYLALIDGNGGKNVRWTINLTNGGTINAADPVLYDGVHTIVLTAADKAGEYIPGPNDPYGRPDERYMVAFRIDHKAPRSAVTVTGIDPDNKNIVYGNVAYQNPGNTAMFTLDVTGDDANLEKVELNIKNTTTTKAEPPIYFTAGSTPTGSTATWTYYPYDLFQSGTLNPALPSPFPLTPPPAVPLIEDYVLFQGKYGVPKTLFTDDGKYDVKVVAYDTWGNKSEEFVFQFTYDKTPPVIEFTNPLDIYKNAAGTANTLKPENFIYLANPSLAPNPTTLPGTTTPNPDYNAAKYANINRLTSQNLRIQGNVKDTFSPVREVESRVEKWNWVTSGTNMVGTWTQVEDWKPIKNFSTNQQTTVSWTKNLLGQDKDNPDFNAVTGDFGTGLDLRTPAGGDLTTAEGLYRIKVRAKDASVIAIPPGTNDWNTTTGQGNPVESDYQYFYFDRTNPTLKITKINDGQSMDTYYSKPEKGFTFEGTVTDNNRFAKVEVKFEIGTVGQPGYKLYTKDATLTALAAGDDDYTTPVDNPARTDNTGGVTQKWKAEFLDAASYPDGKYKVTVTVYDMTGRSTSETKTFILDSTPPTVKFTLPAKVQNKGFGDDGENKKPNDSSATANGFASVIVPGGPTSVITGETGDKVGPGGEAGSESGIDQMWFHLGFIDGATYDNNNQFPNKAAIKAWEDTLIGRHAPAGTNVANLTVKQRNAWMDTIAEYRAQNPTDNKGNAWFKLGGTRKPTGFVINNPNIYDWRFEIPDKTDAAPIPITDPNYQDHYDTMVDGNRLSSGGVQIEGLKLYTGTITVKGRQYTVGSGSYQMVRAIAGQAGGVYRLPLWVRLTDVAGNVEYYCHDIWIDANGSIPSTSIESPSNGTQYNARGGTISVDGVARSNTSVYDVIFRVFADAVPDTNLDGIQTNGKPANTNKTIGANDFNDRPLAANIVRITGYDPAEAGTVAKLPTDAYYQTAWQKANLTLKGGSGEPVVPWSVMLNSEDQIKDLISTRGFASAGATKDMIRVWMEVFVFNGEGAPIRSSVYPNDNLGTASYHYTGTNGGWLYGTATADPTSPATLLNSPGPRPYVRAFYIRTGAAAITHPNVGTWTADYKAPSPAPNPPLPTRANFTWNIEDAGKQGGGGYGGSGTETRSNKFAFSATLDPNPSGTSGSGLGEVAYRIKLDDGSYSTWTTVWKASDTPATLPESVNSNGVRISVRDTQNNGNRIRYYFDYAIDSKSANPSPVSGTNFAPVNGGLWATTGGTVTLQIRMKDNSPQPNEAEQTIQVGVDNFAPLTDKNYRTNPKVAGSNVNFMGRVYDYATTPPMNTEYTPRKLERVSVWFTKDGRYVNMNQKNTTVASLTGMRTINVYQNRDAAVVGGGASDAVSSITLSTTSPGTVTNNFSYPGLGAQQPYNADYVRDITQATGQPQYKMLWSPVSSAVYDVRWQLTLDSTLLPDGELTLHYIVVDAAGNASYYTQTGISVRNNYPEITSVTLYTNNDGQGAAYTADAVQAYDLNKYRSKMFANYTDSDDHDKKDKTTGYLNSGFISKNSYVGFKVETSNGNRPLNFRLQHVKREKLVLDAAGLGQMVTDRATAGKINLYTIKWHGNYTPQKWKALGVPIDNNPNPTLGTHFVFNPVNITDPTKPFVVADAVGTAEVWRYTTSADVTRADIRNPTVPNQAQNADPFAYGPTASLNPTPFADPAGAFEFKGTAHFDPAASPLQNTPVTKIGEYYGSHPEAGAGDLNADNPDNTAFFLIRVWDSVNTNANWTDIDGTSKPVTENEQLYDALVVGMNVYQTDKNAPVARLYDLNPYTETAVITNNKPQTIKDAADPIAIGNNIVRGGLYNDGSDKELVRSGFIDPRGGSTALNPGNGVYYKEALWPDYQLINGVAYSDYPLKVAGDTVPAAGNDKVSGKVILRGFAWDDQLIDEIRISIGGGTANTILKLTGGKMAATGAGIRTIDGQSVPVAFAAETLHWKTGHSVEWAYVWDTSLAPINNAPSTTPVVVQVVVKDVKSSPGTSVNHTVADETASPATSKIFHNTVSVDVVPYITGFERQTPKFTTKRSLQGWYSFFREETGVKVKGYNFGTGAATISIGGTGMTVTGAATATQRTFDIPAGASSGEITMTTSGSPAYNNTSSTTGKSWNKESNAYTPGSDLWINHHYAHIWRTVQAEGSGTGTGAAGTIFAANGNSADLDSPGMSLQYTGASAGRLHGSWTVYGRESLFYAQNNNTKPTVTNETQFNGNTHTSEGNYNQNSRSLLLIKAGEPYSYSDIDYYNGANDDNYTNNTSVVTSYMRDGQPWLVLKPRLTSVVFNNTGNAANGDGGGGDASYYITSQVASSTDRWKNTRIKKAAVSSANNHPGKVFVTTYDSLNKRLFFKTINAQLNYLSGSSQVGGYPTDDNNGGTALYLDGGGTLTGSIGGTVAATQGAGNWSALDYTSQGYPVVAYFDEEHQTLRLAYSNSATPTAGNNWTRRYVLTSTNPLYLGSGSHVSMKIDHNNRIHLAFYNSTYKAIVYATAASTTADFTASVIDRVVEGGQWTDIAVDRSGNPWIVYADSARTGNRDGVRFAYRTQNYTNNTEAAVAGTFSRPLTDPISGVCIRGWEALTMPADYSVRDDRLNIEAWPPSGGAASLAADCPIGSWNAAIGYASDQFRVGYFFKPTVPMGF